MPKNLSKIETMSYLLGDFASNKIKFLLENYEDKKTQLIYFRLFQLYVKNFEKINNRDYIDFTNEQKDNVVEGVPTSSFRTQKQVLSLLRVYESWAIRTGLNKTGVNYTENISTSYLNKFIRTNSLKRKFITKEDILMMEKTIEEQSDMADQLLSGQYFLCLLLPFYSIYGRACDEMTNLTKYDINFDTKTIKVRGQKGDREIVVDDFLLNYLDKAIHEESIATSYGIEPWELYDVSNVLKCTIVPKYKETSDGTLGYGGIRERLLKILNEYERLAEDSSFQNVTPQSLKTSGKISKLQEIEKQNNGLNATDFKMINELFGDSPDNYFPLKEDYYAFTRVD